MITKDLADSGVWSTGLWAVAMAEAFEVSAQNGHPVNVRELVNR